MIPHDEFLGKVAGASNPLAVPEKTREVMHKDYAVNLNNEPMKNRTDFNRKTGKLDKEEWDPNKFHEGISDAKSELNEVKE